MQKKRISVRGITFDDTDLNEAEEICRSFLVSGKTGVVFTPNSEIVYDCVRNNELKNVINSADLIIPDGAGVVLASKILRDPLKKGKVAGIDLFERVISYCAKEGVKVFLLGGRPGVAEKAAENLKKRYPGLEVAGTRDGYFEKSGEESDEAVRTVNDSGARFVGVCLGAPVQEKWIYENRDRFDGILLGGFGGSLDVFAGVTKRAPKIFIKLRLEWLYRLLKEPKRIGRMMKIPKFLIGCVFCKKKKSEKTD